MTSEALGVLRLLAVGPVGLVLVLVWNGAALGAAVGVPEPAAEPGPTVILISLDGTTFQQIQWAQLETIPALMERGATASRLIPVFPTNTFPNHVTLVTGVAPARHGIVNNTFRDPERGLYDKSDDPTWILREPIWSIAARHGVVSAAFHWVGSEGGWTNGLGPRHWVKFDSDIREQRKVEKILSWLDLPDPAERPRLVTAWFHGADHAGHRHGPEDPAVARALRGQDAALGHLVEGLERRGAFATTTLLLVSDHGMHAVSDRVDLVRALRDAGIDAEVFGAGGFASVRVRGGGEQAERAAEVARDSGLEAHLRSKAPEELGVDVPRFGDLVVLAPPGTSISRGRLLSRLVRGMHGYRPDVPSMAGIFIARGRGSRSGVKLGSVRSLDVTPTILALLGIPIPAWVEGRPLAQIVPEGDAISP